METTTCVHLAAHGHSKIHYSAAEFFVCFLLEKATIRCFSITVPFNSIRLVCYESLLLEVNHVLNRRTSAISHSVEIGRRQEINDKFRAQKCSIYRNIKKNVRVEGFIMTQLMILYPPSNISMFSCPSVLKSWTL